jgi:hypothetical protein
VTMWNSRMLCACAAPFYFLKGSQASLWVRALQVKKNTFFFVRICINIFRDFLNVLWELHYDILNVPILVYTDPHMCLKYCDTSWPILGLGIPCTFLNTPGGERYIRYIRTNFYKRLNSFRSRMVVTSTWWEGLVLPMVPRAMPAES